MNLIHTTDLDPGFRRKIDGEEFIYLDSNDVQIEPGDTLDRINALAIPPAYQSVWICALANGHLQATGRDPRNRKQYRYHQQWLEQRNKQKFHSLVDFAEVLPKIRSEIAAILRQHGLGKDQVAALATAIIDRTGARVGNASYKKSNGTHGITTLQEKHAETSTRRLQLHYRGKHGKNIDLTIESPALARRLTKCMELPGQALFEYEDDDGKAQKLDSGDVNQLISRLSSADVTAKTFRTWRGSLITFQYLLGLEDESDRAMKKHEVAAVRSAASSLHNTMATSRKYYVHPGILEAWLGGTFAKLLKDARNSRSSQQLEDPDERLFANVLRQIHG